MKMKKTLLLIFISLILAVLLSGCSKKDPLLGTWQEPVSGISLVFKEDGSILISMHETTYTMQYTEQTPNGLVIKVSTDGTIPNLTMTYAVSKDNNQLDITVNNVDTIFQRVK
jgi:major membrane immunogen (membrane-anchored lipoprotein)